MEEYDRLTGVEAIAQTGLLLLEENKCRVSRHKMHCAHKLSGVASKIRVHECQMVQSLPRKDVQTAV